MKRSLESLFTNNFSQFFLEFFFKQLNKEIFFLVFRTCYKNYITKITHKFDGQVFFFSKSLLAPQLWPVQTKQFHFEISKFSGIT